MQHSDMLPQQAEPVSAIHKGGSPTECVSTDRQPAEDHDHEAEHGRILDEREKISIHGAFGILEERQPVEVRRRRTVRGQRGATKVVLVRDSNGISG